MPCLPCGVVGLSELEVQGGRPCKAYRGAEPLCHGSHNFRELLTAGCKEIEPLRPPNYSTGLNISQGEFLLACPYKLPTDGDGSRERVRVLPWLASQTAWPSQYSALNAVHSPYSLHFALIQMYLVRHAVMRPREFV